MFISLSELIGYHSHFCFRCCNMKNIFLLRLCLFIVRNYIDDIFHFNLEQISSDASRALLIIKFITTLTLFWPFLPDIESVFLKIGWRFNCKNIEVSVVIAAIYMSMWLNLLGASKYYNFLQLVGSLLSIYIVEVSLKLEYWWPSDLTLVSVICESG